MRFLTLVSFLCFAAFACKNESKTDESKSLSEKAAAAGDTTAKQTASPYVFTDTILVSLGAKDFAAVLKSKPNIPILDIRTPEQFKTGHVWKSTNLDLHEKNFLARIASFGRGQDYAIYCQFGNESLKIAEEMKRLGFKRIYHLQGGLNTWGDSGQALQLK